MKDDIVKILEKSEEREKDEDHDEQDDDTLCHWEEYCQKV